MNIASTIARYLLGLTFTVFGLNGFLGFLHMPPPPPLTPAWEFMHATAGATHFMAFVFAIQLVCGLMLLADVYVPLALIVIAPVIVNILLFHITMDPAGIVPGLVVTVLWVMVAVRNRSVFAPLFQPRWTAAGTQSC